MNSGPGSKAEARRRNVQEKKIKLEEVPEMKLKHLNLRLRQPTRATPQPKIFKIFKYLKDYPGFFLSYYEVFDNFGWEPPIQFEFGKLPLETGWNWCVYVRISSSQILTEQDCAPVNVLISWDATDSCSCQQSGAHYHYEEVTCGDLGLPCVVMQNLFHNWHEFACEYPWWILLDCRISRNIPHVPMLLLKWGMAVT